MFARLFDIPLPPLHSSVTAELTDVSMEVHHARCSFGYCFRKQTSAAEGCREKSCPLSAGGCRERSNITPSTRFAYLSFISSIPFHYPFGKEMVRKW